MANMISDSTIYKVNITLSDFNTHYYSDYKLTLAKHSTEEEEQMMFRLLAFLYCAHEDLVFTKGGNPQEPKLWQKNYGGDIIQWIELGLPDEKRIRQACGKSENVVIFTHHGEDALTWFKKIKGKLIKKQQVKVFHLDILDNGPLEKIVDYAMKLSCIIEDQSIFLGNDQERVEIGITQVK